MKADRKPVNLFFIEIIISLLVFSISGAVILRVFAAADAKSRQSSMLESVVVTAQSLAEVYSLNGDASKAVSTVLGNGAAGDMSEIFLEDGKVKLEISEEKKAFEAGELRELYMRFTMEDKELYSLNCSAYVSGGGADE